MTVTMEDVGQAVAAHLKEHFPTVKRFDEEIEQNISPPSFFIKLFPSQQDREFGRRYMRRHSFDIHYFSASLTSYNAEYRAMAEQLYDVMEYISINGIQTRGRSMRHEIIDRVLHFFVDYDFHVLRPAPVEPTMQELEQEGRIK